MDLLVIVLVFSLSVLLAVAGARGILTIMFYVITPARPIGVVDAHDAVPRA